MATLVGYGGNIPSYGYVGWLRREYTFSLRTALAASPRHGLLPPAHKLSSAGVGAHSDAPQR
eukprot:2903840-Pyramimonas_sp.AAC.1